MARLVALIERLEDLSHVLMWSHMESERSGGGGGGGGNPFGSSGGDESTRRSRCSSSRGSASPSRRRSCPTAPCASTLASTRALHLRAARRARAGPAPRAAARAHRCSTRRATPSSSSRRSRSRCASTTRRSRCSHSCSSSQALDGVARQRDRRPPLPLRRPPLAGVPRAPSLAACLNLLLLRWLARDLRGGVPPLRRVRSDGPHARTRSSSGSCSPRSRTTSSPKRTRCACASRSPRARARRQCPRRGAWRRAAALYLAKFEFIPASCQLSAHDELTLLRAHGARERGAKSRVAFLDAAFDAHRSRRTRAASVNNPPLSSAAARGDASRRLPDRPAAVRRL